MPLRADPAAQNTQNRGRSEAAVDRETSVPGMSERDCRHAAQWQWSDLCHALARVDARGKRESLVQISGSERYSEPAGSGHWLRSPSPVPKGLKAEF